MHNLKRFLTSFFILGMLMMSLVAQAAPLKLDGIGKCGPNAPQTTIHMSTDGCHKMGGQAGGPGAWVTSWSSDCLLEVCEFGKFGLAPANSVANRVAYALIPSNGADCSTLGGAVNGNPGAHETVHCHMDIAEGGDYGFSPAGAANLEGTAGLETTSQDCQSLGGSFSGDSVFGVASCQLGVQGNLTSAQAAIAAEKACDGVTGSSDMTVACVHKMWEEAGCTTRNNFVHGWIQWASNANLSLNSMKNDFYLWATMMDEGHKNECKSGIQTGVNVAPRGFAIQSSDAWGGDAERAIDGNTSGLWANGSVTHTDNKGSWWKVDLAENTRIQNIRIFRRTDWINNSLELHQFNVEVLATDGVTVVKQFGPFPLFSENHFDVREVGGTIGAAVRISIPGPYLSLAEVQVFGQNVCDGVTGNQNMTEACADQLWAEAGCTTDRDNSGWIQWARNANLSMDSMKNDFYLWATMMDEGHKNGCQSGVQKGTNVARKGKASQSSEGWGGAPSRAIDGNTSGDYDDSSVTHTNGPNSWWAVNLPGNHTIDNIRIWNRTSCCGDRLNQFSVDILAQGGKSVVKTLGPFPAFNGAYFDVPRAGGVRGTAVAIRMGGEYLSLAEVEVFARNSNPVVISKALTLETLESKLAAKGLTLTTGDVLTKDVCKLMNYNSGDDLSLAGLVCGATLDAAGELVDWTLDEVLVEGCDLSNPGAACSVKVGTSDVFKANGNTITLTGPSLSSCNGLTTGEGGDWMLCAGGGPSLGSVGWTAQTGDKRWGAGAMVSVSKGSSFMMQHKDGVFSIAVPLGRLPIDISLTVDLKATKKVMDDHGVTDGLNHLADQALPGDLAAHEQVLSYAAQGVGYVAKGYMEVREKMSVLGFSSGDSTATKVGKVLGCVAVGPFGWALGCWF